MKKQIYFSSFQYQRAALLNIITNMLPRVQFHPDIQTKFEHLLTHMTDKNKITQELIKILQQICNLEFFYSKALDNFANSISKLLLGKDPLKDILIVLQRIIASKCEQSQKLANQIKDDLIPHLRGSVNVKGQQALREKQGLSKCNAIQMQKKLRMLFTNESNFKKAVVEANSLPKIMPVNQKLKALELYRKKQDQFSDSIDSFNLSLDEYMIKYSQICQQLSDLQTARKTCFRDSISKLVIFQINYIKNLQYNFSRYMQNLQKMEGRLIIQDRILGGGQGFYNTKDGGVIQLARISNKNYIDSIIGKKKVNETLLAEEVKVSELRSTYQPGQIDKQTYQNLVKTLFPILTFVLRQNHTNLLIDVVVFSNQIFKSKNGLKVTLLNSLLCHELFGNQEFWIQYSKRLQQKILREQNMSIGNEETFHRNSKNVVERDLQILKMIQVNPFITITITTVFERLKLDKKQSPHIQHTLSSPVLNLPSESGFENQPRKMASFSTTNTSR